MDKVVSFKDIFYKVINYLNVIAYTCKCAHKSIAPFKLKCSRVTRLLEIIHTYLNG